MAGDIGRRLVLKRLHLFEQMPNNDYCNNPEVIELNVAVGTYVVRLNTVQGPAVYKVHINR